METNSEHTDERHEPRATDIRTELIAGVTTFFTMAYIVVVDPLILSGRASDPPVDTGMPFSGVLTFSDASSTSGSGA